MNTLFSLLYSWFLITCTYFCLWGVADYLLQDTRLAFLFLPFALRLGLCLHLRPTLWLAPLLAESTVLLFVSFAEHTQAYLPLLLLSAVSFPIVFLIQPYYQGNQGFKLLLQGILALSLSLLNALVLFCLNAPFAYSMLVSFTGALLLLPMCYLLQDFLFARQWVPLTARVIHHPITLRSKHIVVYTLLLILNILIQTYLPEEFNRFSLFFLAIPIILLAYYYGWQGALLGSLINSVALIASTQHFSHLDLTDLLLSLCTQTITGIFLGLAIQRQRELNQHLGMELKRNRSLTHQLISSEENIRKELARELHDQIGQNITAIRTQANILKRLNPQAREQQSATMIEQLSLNIYDSVRGLLNRLRPRVLDDLPLQQVLQNVLDELGLAQQHIHCQFEWHNPQHLSLDPLLEITLYRLYQEALNNIIKHAQASEIHIAIHIGQQVILSIQDNGKGFDPEQPVSGLGLRGMQERVALIGGEFHLRSKMASTPTQPLSPSPQGTSLVITLPRF
ncbi:signal transduction histidine-protein kinase/phosphatase UhpB [Pasteurella sp. PK-2025]|uniref:signal transduction histidine-protein kinase/phosphatase UhpB n=1 Tax=Pasteurella sp. PK-2025 TaxID=3413133 RepID=UPI003C71C63C